VTTAGSVAGEERLDRIRARLERDGRVRIGPLAAELDVSDMTIRRDLQELEQLGYARRVRGGAVAIGPATFADRQRHRSRAKSAIAAKLFPLVPSSGAIGVDASTTLLRLANTITAGRDLTVLTNGLETFHALAAKPGVTAHLTGGRLEPKTGSLVGPVACRGAANILLQRSFMSAAAVDPSVGASETSLEEAEVKRAIAAVSAEVILAVDSSKLSTRAMGLGLEWDRVRLMVTELDPSDRRLDPYREVVTLL
jgi:DeoR family fructose operon transcriptional repressor